MRSLFFQTIGRAALASAAFLSSSLAISETAEAHRVRDGRRYWVPPQEMKDTPIVTPFCDGKYDMVARNLNRQDIVGRINLYRENSGLPPLQLTEQYRTRGGGGNYTRAETRLRDAQLLLDRRQTHLSLAAEADYVNTLNKATWTGSDLDWWLKTERPYEIEQAKRVRSHSGFDWLMTDHQLRLAESEWRMRGSRKTESLKKIYAHVDKQATIRPGINIWMGQYQFHKALNHDLPPEIASRAQQGVAEVMTCQASPAQYAILAKGDLGLPMDYLPKTLAARRNFRDIQFLAVKAMTTGNGLDASFRTELDQLAQQFGVRENNELVSVLKLLSAPDLDAALSEVPEGDRKGLLLFALPADQMPDYEPAMAMGHALTEGEIALGLRIAPRLRDAKLAEMEKEIAEFQKRIERNKSSGSYVRHLRQQMTRIETRYKAYKNRDVLDTDLPDIMKVTLSALWGQARHNHDAHHRDVYKEQTSEAFLNIYLRRRLFPGTHFHPWHWRSYNTVSQKYLDGKNHPNSVAFKMQSLRKNDGTPEQGFAALVDWDKLPALGDEKRLTRTIALNVINWLDQATPKERTRHADLMSQALYDIIRMSRHENPGDFKGAPVQKRAFERLHKYYGETQAAKTTKYWWASRKRHGVFGH